eukprot:scaffold11068_cov61-Phaeocystis_antarctica.AAC.1
MAYAKSCRVNRERFFGSAILRAAGRRQGATRHAHVRKFRSECRKIGFEPHFGAILAFLAIGKGIFYALN